jgi:hypothetical protein
MWRLGVAIEGLSNLKVLGSLFKTADRFDIEFVPIIARGGGGKDYDIATPKLLTKTFSAIRAENIYYYSDFSFEELINQVNIQALLTLNPYRKYSSHISYLRQRGIATFGLDYFVGSLYAAAWEGLEDSVRTALTDLTARFVASDFWRDVECELNNDSATYQSKLISAGTPVAQVYDYIDPDRSPFTSEPYICLLAPNIRAKHLFSFYGLGTVFKIRRILSLLRRFCHENGYTFIIKNREKQWDSKLYHYYADQVVTDDPTDVYPYTSALILQHCQVMLHFGSMAVLEAAATNVPSLGIEVQAIDRLHDYMTPQARKVINNRIFSLQEKTLYNFDSVSMAVPINISYQKLANMCHRLISSRSQAAAQFAEFNSIFNGRSTQSSTERILHHIVNHLTATIK